MLRLKATSAMGPLRGFHTNSAASRHRMKTRIISYSEIEERFREIISALERDPSNEEFIIEKGVQLVLVLNLCVSQMKAADSRSYPEKRVHLTKLEEAQAAITYKINTCTVDEISRQLTGVYRAFGVQ